MKTREEALRYGLSFSDTYQDAPFHDPNWQLVRYKGNKKAFLWTYERDGFINLNVKAEPEKAFFWRDQYSSVIPGYHQNKEHWNTIILDGSIPDKDICLMIADSYHLISDSPAKRIYDAVRKIPYGHVATYAQVAEMAGDRKMARAVGNALHKNPDPATIPCYRVVNAKGELADAFAFGGVGIQAERLRAEGVEVVDDKVDLQKYQMQRSRCIIRNQILHHRMPKDHTAGI
jgi:O-6-methylguanine DNA methyltransferase